MRGDLSETRLSTVLRDLDRSDGTGALHLDGPSGSAKIFVRDGDVYFASSPAPRAQLGARLVGAGFVTDDELDDALAAQEQGPDRVKLGALLVDHGVVRRDVIRVFVQEQILDAVFDLARWDTGSFEFFRGDAVSEDLPVQIRVEPLIMEVERRLAEWDDIRTVIPSLDAVPDFSPGGSTTRAALEPDEFTVLTSVDGRRSVRELAHDLGYSQFDAARLVYGLSLLGVIGVANGETAQATEEETAAAEPPATEPERAETAGSEDEDVDVGRALEEALFGGDYFGGGEPTEPSAEPAAAEVEDTPPAADVEEVEEDLEDAAREAVEAASVIGEEREQDEIVGTDDLEPEVWTASIDVDDDETPAVHDEPSAAGSVQDVQPEPAPPPRSAERDAAPTEASPEARDELMALVNELGGGDEPEAAQEPDPSPEADPVPEPDQVDQRGDEPTVEHEPAPTPSPDDGAAPEAERRVERGDVSELLRELSRLAGGGPEPVAPTPEDTSEEQSAREPGGEEGEPEPSRPRDAQADRGEAPKSETPKSEAPKKDKDDGDDKRSTFRRLFGSR